VRRAAAPARESLADLGRPLAGCYAPVRALGEGGTARVHLVQDLRTGRSVALKWCPADDLAGQHQLRAEYRLLGFLAHPQVPEVHDLGRDEDAGVAWLAMERVEGRNLADALAEADPPAVARLLAQALNVLEFLHRRGVVHGDLKPEHLVVATRTATCADTVRLLDFGFSVDTLLPPEHLPLRGTGAYLAPSLLRGQRPSPRTDIYALGRAFLAALPGGAARLAPEVRRVLDRLAATDDHLRYPSAQAALRDLERDVPGIGADLPLPREASFQGQDRAVEEVGRVLGELERRWLTKPLVLVTGLPGSGRTRFLLETQREAALRGIHAVRAQVAQGASPLEPVLALARALCARFPDARAALDDVVAAIARKGQDPGPPSLAAIRELGHWFRRLGEREPLVAILDDADLADEWTSAFLGIHARTAAKQGPLIVVGTSPTSAMTQALGSEPRVAAPNLAPLSGEQACALVASLLPARSRAEVRELAQVSQGNPAVATVLAREAANPAPPAGHPAAPFLDSLLEARCSALPKAARRTLLDLAVLLRPAPEALLAALDAEAAPDLADRLGALETAGLATCEREGGEARWRIASQALRRHVRARAAREAWRGRHRAALKAWSAWPTPEDRPLPMLVEHALHGGDAAQALALGLPAVRALASQGALAAAGRLVDGLLPIARARRAAEQDELALLAAEVGIRRGTPSTVAQQLRERLDGEERAPAPPERARLLLLLGCAQAGDGEFEAARESLTEARSLAGEGTPAADWMRLCEQLAAVCLRLGEGTAARRHLEDGRARIHEAPVSAEAADLWDAIACEESRAGRREAARAAHDHALSIRRERGDLFGEAGTLGKLAALALRAGELSEARALDKQSLRLTRQVGTPKDVAERLLSLARIETLRGDYGVALARWEEAEAVGRQLGDALAEARARVGRAEVLRLKGELVLAREQLDQAERLLPENGAGAAVRAAVRNGRARLALALGRLEEAEALSDPPGLGGTSEAEVEARVHAHLVRAAAREGAGDLASARAEFGAARALARGSDQPLLEFEAATGLGRAWLLGGDLTRAEETLTTAHADTARAGHALLRAQAALGLARVAVEGRDLDAAFGWLREGRRLAEELGVPDLWIDACGECGRHAAAGGLLERAVTWWRRALQAMLAVAERAGDPEAEVPVYVRRADRRWIVTALDGALRAIRDERLATAEGAGSKGRV
jgi:tetratricopeptide (TPR) repeat protein